MNELERAAHELVTRPQREPTPLAHLEARAAETRRRRVAVRALSVAAALLLVIAGLGLGARQRGDDVEVRLGSERPPQSGELRVRASMDDDAPFAQDAAMLTVVRARLVAFGVTDAVIIPDPTSPSFDLRATGLTFDEARLLIETMGNLYAAEVFFTSGLDPCESPTKLHLSVGWPLPEPPGPPCYTAMGEATPIAGTVPMGSTGTRLPPQPVLRSAARADGASWAVTIDLRDETAGGTVPLTAPFLSAPALVFDGVLLRDPLTPLADQRPGLEQTTTGWIVRGFTERDARLLAAILTGGAIGVPLHVSLLDTDGHPRPAPSKTTSAPSPSDATEVPASPSPSTTFSGPGAELAFFIEGADDAVTSSIDRIRTRFELLGLHVSRFEVGDPLTNGTGKRPVGLRVDNAESARTLEQVLLFMARPGLPAFAPIRSVQRISSHYPPECKVAAWGGECFMVGDDVSVPNLLSGARVLADDQLDVTLREAGVLDQLVALCRARQETCPTGELALTVDGSVLGVVDVAVVEPGAGHAAVAVSGPLREGVLAQYAILLSTGPLGEDVLITFTPDPTPPAGGPEQPVPTTVDPAPDTTLPTIDVTTTAPGPGATAPVCGNTPPMTDGPNC